MKPGEPSPARDTAGRTADVRHRGVVARVVVPGVWWVPDMVRPLVPTRGTGPGQSPPCFYPCNSGSSQSGAQQSVQNPYPILEGCQRMTIFVKTVKNSDFHEI